MSVDIKKISSNIIMEYKKRNKFNIYDCDCENFQKVYSRSLLGKIVVISMIILTFGLFLLLCIDIHGNIVLGCEYEERKKIMSCKKYD
jgi:hypothetical protein